MSSNPKPSTLPHGATAKSSIDLSKRDLTLDLARVFCVLLVVVIHLLEVGVGTDATGTLSVTRPLEKQFWFTGVTWVGQIMPLFFVVGGFASLTAWRSLQRRGGDGRDYVTARILRLAQPAFPLFVFFVVVIGAAVLIVAPALGVDRGLIDAIVGGAGSPLWFIAAYGICQVFVPVLAGWHARAPYRTVLVLFAAVIVVDALRYGTGIPQIGYANMFLVWPLAQQFGFFYADGWFDRRPAWVLVLIMLGGVAALAPLSLIGPYDTNMLVNLNPPTLPLVFLGLSQAAFLRLVKRPLTSVMRTRGAKAVVFLVGTRLMTIYLWHLPLIITFAGLSLLIPGASPSPGSAPWWWSRILVYVLVLAALFALSLLVGRWEVPRELGGTPPRAFIVLASVLTIVPPFVEVEYLLNLPIAVAGALGTGIAILILGRWGLRWGARIADEFEPRLATPNGSPSAPLRS
ncbi:MAG TPA: acyltransferase [Pseudolysinimonas sp.]|nr:acyltransferase [Pseudolysinimonas sp.]